VLSDANLESRGAAAEPRDALAAALQPGPRARNSGKSDGGGSIGGQGFARAVRRGGGGGWRLG